MITTINNETLFISWSHHLPTYEPNINDNLQIFIDKGSTTIIVKNENKEVVFLKTFNVYYKDQFSKEKGRRASLKEFCKNYDRETRRKIWHDYWKTKNVTIETV